MPARPRQLSHPVVWPSSDRLRGEWFHAPRSPKAIAVAVHGLNARPERLDALALELSRAGISSFRLILRGHGDSGPAELGAFRAPGLARDWLADVEGACKLAAAQAERLAVPLLYVGYSLGALLWLHLRCVDRRDYGVQRALFFAPPLYTRWPARCLGMLSGVSGRVLIPSVAPKNYRVHRGTSIHAYRDLMVLRDRVLRAGLSEANVPALVLMDRRDELVDVVRLERELPKLRLSHWKARHVRSLTRHHLIVDEACLGAEQWRLLIREGVEHLLGV